MGCRGMGLAFRGGCLALVPGARGAELLGPCCWAVAVREGAVAAADQAGGDGEVLPQMFQAILHGDGAL